MWATARKGDTISAEDLEVDGTSSTRRGEADRPNDIHPKTPRPNGHGTMEWNAIFVAEGWLEVQTCERGTRCN